MGTIPGPFPLTSATATTRTPAQDRGDLGLGTMALEAATSYNKAQGQVVADATARAAATPAFAGQRLVQLDTGQEYFGNSTTIGDWLVGADVYGTKANVAASVVLARATSTTITASGNDPITVSPVGAEANNIQIAIAYDSSSSNNCTVAIAASGAGADITAKPAADNILTITITLTAKYANGIRYSGNVAIQKILADMSNGELVGGEFGHAAGTGHVGFADTSGYVTGGGYYASSFPLGGDGVGTAADTTTISATALAGGVTGAVHPPLPTTGDFNKVYVDAENGVMKIWDVTGAAFENVDLTGYGFVLANTVPTSTTTAINNAIAATGIPATGTYNAIFLNTYLGGYPTVKTNTLTVCNFGVVLGGTFGAEQDWGWMSSFMWAAQSDTDPAGTTFLSGSGGSWQFTSYTSAALPTVTDLTIAASAKTITRNDAGDFQADGYRPGQEVQTAGFTAHTGNNASFLRVVKVTSTVLYLAAHNTSGFGDETKSTATVQGSHAGANPAHKPGAMISYNGGFQPGVMAAADAGANEIYIDSTSYLLSYKDWGGTAHTITVS